MAGKGLSDEFVSQMMRAIESGEVDLYGDDDDDDDDEYYDDDDDEYYDSDEESDDSFAKYEVPPRVRRALDARRRIYSPDRDKDGNVLSDATSDPNPNPPVDEEAVRLFQQHVKNGLFKPEMEGGYIDMMRNLGATPKSTDPYVKDVEYNRWLFTLGHMDEDEIEERRLSGLKRHKAQVRYLRYQEYVNRYYPPTDTKIASNGYYWGSENDAKQRNDYVGPKCTLQQTDDEVQSLRGRGMFVDEDDLEKRQFEFLMNDFISTFFWYVNEKCRLGRAAGMKPESMKMESSDSVQYMEFDMSMETILEQCNEVDDMYQEKKQPCGMFLEENHKINTAMTTTTNKKSGKNKKKNNKKKNAQVPKFKPDYQKHQTRIEKDVSGLIYALEQKILTGSLGSARVLKSIATMMWRGALHDPYIAWCILFHQNGKVLNSVINICKLCVKYAKEAFMDTSRLTLAGHMWWNAYGEVTNIIAFSFRGFQLGSAKELNSNEDLHFSSEAVFKKTVMPYFLDIIDPKHPTSPTPAVWYCEESAVWNAISNILQTFSKPFGAKFIKTHWNIIESYCCRDTELEMAQRKFKTEREQEYERFMGAQSLAEAVMLISNLCGYGFDVQEGFSRMIVPGPLALAILKKGAVSLLVKLSRSKYDLVSQLAVYGLSQMTRIKDCRDLLYQLPNDEGIKFVNDMMTSKDADCASNNMLVILHLSWDDEWNPKLLAMEPKIEESCLKLAAFAMKSLLDRLDQMKLQKEKLDYLGMKLSTKKFRATANEKERLEDEEEELQRRRKAADWEVYESDVAPESDIYLLTISRAMLALSSGVFRRDSIGRLEATNPVFFHLLASSIDSPFPDTAQTVFTLLHNFLHCGGSADPSHFPDPEHVVASIFDRIIEMADAKNYSERSAILMFIARALYRRPKWKPIFEAIAKTDNDYQMFMGILVIPEGNEELFKRAAPSSNSNMSPREGHVPLRHGIHSSCAVNTGRLAKCNSCGRLESKRGEWKKCSRCKSVVYCGRACQKDDWPSHKKVCKKLSKSSA